MLLLIHRHNATVTLLVVYLLQVSSSLRHDLTVERDTSREYDQVCFPTYAPASPHSTTRQNPRHTYFPPSYPFTAPRCQCRASRREFHFVEIDGMCTQFGTFTKIWTFICRLRRITFWAYYVNKSEDSIWKRLKISTRVRWERTSGFLAGGKYEISWQIEQSSYYMPIWTSTLVWHLAACVAHGDVRVWKACEVKVEF